MERTATSRGIWMEKNQNLIDKSLSKEFFYGGTIPPESTTAFSGGRQIQLPGGQAIAKILPLIGRGIEQQTKKQTKKPE